MEAYPQEENVEEQALVGEDVALEVPEGESEGILPYLSEKFPQKIEKVFQKFLEELTVHGMTEEDAKDRLLQELMHTPAFEYTIWRVILVEPDYQETEEEIQESQEAAVLFDWLQGFGGGQALDGQSIDILLCNYFPNRNYTELLDYLTEEYPDVPDVELMFLRNKVREQEMEGMYLESDNGEDHNDSTVGKSKVPPPLQPVRGQRGSVSGGRTPKLQKNNGRTRWLYENARIARMYLRRWEGNVFKAFISEIGISVGFRAYMTIWFVAATAFAVVYGFHAMFTLFHRLFSPFESEYLASAAVFACILLSIIFTGSYFTALDRILKGWIFLDDETYFGDQNWAEAYNSKISEYREQDLGECANPVEATQAMHLLPPVVERTFLFLPGGKKGWFRRELWMGILVISSTIAPFFYAAISAAVDEANAFSAIGHFVHFNLMSALAITFCYWFYMWYFGLRKKYQAYKRNKGMPEQLRLALDLEFLQEWGLDERSVRRNIFTLGLCAAPLLVMFWITSYDDLKVTTNWIITSGAIFVLLLFLREVWRSETWKERMPYVVLILIAIFFIFGLIGAIQAKSYLIVVFVLLSLGTQLFLIRHRQVANVDEVSWLLEFSKSLQQGGMMSPTPAGDTETQMEPKTPGQRQRDVRKRLRKTLKLQRAISRTTDPNREGSFIPGSKILGAIFDLPCYNKCCGAKDDIVEETLPEADHTKRGWWRLPDRYWGDVAVHPTIETKGRCEPLEKLVISVSPRLAGWFVFSFFILTVVALVIIGNSEGEGYLAAKVITGQAESAPPIRPAVCRMRFGESLNIQDLAVLNWLSDKEWGVVHFLISKVFDPNYGPEVVLMNSFDGFQPAFYHFYLPAEKESYFVMRSPPVAETRMRDLDMWGESIVYGVLGAVVPYVRFFDDSLAEKFVHSLFLLKKMLDPDDVRKRDALAFVTTSVQLWAGGFNNTYTRNGNGEEHKVPYTEPITFVGHGSNGGIARLAAARFGLPVVTFNAPGTRWLEERFKVKDNKYNELNVLSDNDIGSTIGAHSGARQYIACSADSMQQCSTIHQTICELQTRCGFSGGRVVVCPP
eukprot:TRINITY_DN996_c1_g1_i1.p1 TRINITY_DN996_c1_g1~~TRINITY_DN996_c1_g1_i1.p1  ORF type:complete len:1073 (+),score=412.44 TRINITY_DN996_c1_g1_i1:161-3379(+)